MELRGPCCHRCLFPQIESPPVGFLPSCCSNLPVNPSPPPSPMGKPFHGRRSESTPATFPTGASPLFSPLCATPAPAPTSRAPPVAAVCRHGATGRPDTNVKDISYEGIRAAVESGSRPRPGRYCQEVDNLTLRRFLRARDHDVGKASAMFLKFLKWRREAVPGGGPMPAELVRAELSHDKACMGGVDRTGRPVLLAFPAKHYSANRDMAEHKRFVVYLLDNICARIPRGQDKFLCIVDLKGWGYSNCDVRAYIAAIEIMQNYYPERLGKALMIHVPYIFMKAWKMVYPFIDINTREKFVFVDDKSLEETLQREMEESQIPEKYGGKLPLVPLKDWPDAVSG